MSTPRSATSWPRHWRCDHPRPAPLTGVRGLEVRGRDQRCQAVADIERDVMRVRAVRTHGRHYDGCRHIELERCRREVVPVHELRAARIWGRFEVNPASAISVAKRYIAVRPQQRQRRRPDLGASVINVGKDGIVVDPRQRTSNARNDAIGDCLGAALTGANGPIRCMGPTSDMQRSLRARRPSRWSRASLQRPVRRGPGWCRCTFVRSLSPPTGTCRRRG